MDACEHEYESMSRHNRKVPTSFYHRFTRQTTAISDQYAQGRVVSVLEGGYSDRALISGAMAHLSGLVDVPPQCRVDEEWWSVENLIKVSKTADIKKHGSVRFSIFSLRPPLRNAVVAGPRCLQLALPSHGLNVL